ncbi:MAG TPA: DUF6266 family protein [Prolixibacteraceae bacterium]|nr:DUF6266 family protein [Prolixibacteraceae bacterium]
MGTIKQGVLGGFSGKVGTVIGFVRNGVACMRGLATSFTDAHTPAQVEQRAKFSLVVKFLRSMVALLRISYKSAAATMSGFNAAVSYTLANGVTGIFPDLDIDYTKVLVSRGNLPGAMNPVAASTEVATIDFTWENNAWDFGAKTTDKVVLVAYSPELNKAITAIGAATRALEAQAMVLPASWSGKEVQTYIGFCTANESEFSNGEFLDAILVL